MRAGGALRQFPLEAEQRFEIAVVPAQWVGSPRAFDAAGDGVHSLAAAEAVLPAQSLFGDVCTFGFVAHMGGVARAVRLAEGVAAGHQGRGFLVVHGHARKGLADVACRTQRVGPPVGAFGVHIDQTHLHGSQGLGEFTVAAVTLVAQPSSLRAPVDLLLGFPNVGPAAAEAQGLEAHRVHGHVASQHHQVGPRQLFAVLLLDGPQQPPRLVEVAGVGPAVQRREALRPGARAPRGRRRCGRCPPRARSCA